MILKQVEMLCRYLSFLMLLLLSLSSVHAQERQQLFPVKGFCIAAPLPSGVNAFNKFIREELATRKINVLVLRVDYNFQYKTHPELRDSIALSEADVKSIVSVCRSNGIQIVPQINLLGHQSWANKVTGLLRVYPQFDETPHVKMPEKYSWPNPDGLYCKSYCPLHPEVHPIVFDIVNEICDVFEANAFHAGMDEVFYIGDDRCPRCGGRDKAELFAGEVKTIHDFLQQKNRRLWIWGDRLIDGKTTGIGMWEASMNNTHRAIDLIPKDVMICDWHYERPDKTAVYFAMKGFDVLTCPWRNSAIALTQVDDINTFRKGSAPEMANRFQGMLQTVWSDAETFLNGFYGKNTPSSNDKLRDWDCFKTVFPKQK
jgi:hypothetical protein